MNIEVLAKNIEEAYEVLNRTIDKLNSLTGIVDQFKSNTQEIIEKYIKTVEPNKIADLRENSKKNLQKMIEDISSIDKALSNYDIVEHQLSENISNFQVKMNNFENTIQSTRTTLQKLDEKLLKLIKEAEKNQQTAQKRFSQASQLFAATIEIEKYEDLLKITKENNVLLKKIVEKDTINKNDQKYKKV